MMLIKSKVLATVGAAIMAFGAAVAATPQHAAASLLEGKEAVSDAIAFSGCTTVLTPVPLTDGPGGTYSFSAPDACTGLTGALPTFCEGLSNPVDQPTDDPTPLVPELGACSFTANGTYSNIVCGTGSTGGGALAGANGNGTDTASINGEGFTPYLTLHYGINFVAGVGVIGGKTDGTSANDANALVVGAVVLTPNNVPCPVASFRATGVALVSEVGATNT
jgi:hypothetical protein